MKICHVHDAVSVEAAVPPGPLQLPWVTWKDYVAARLVWGKKKEHLSP